MLLVNARHHRPRWCLPPRLLDHLESTLQRARTQLDDANFAELEHRVRLVRAGQAPPAELLVRIQALHAG